MSSQPSPRALRTRWSAIGASIAISLGAGGIGIGHATTTSGERPIYVPIEPCRLADTRPEFQVGPKTTPLGPSETYSLSGWGKVGNCVLQSGTTGLSLNVTAINQTLPTFLTLFPGSSTLPNASHLNPIPGQGPIPNAVNVDLDAAGQFNVYNLQGSVDVIIDVVGYYDHHTHDDRYHTKTKVEHFIEGLEADIAELHTRVSALEAAPAGAFVASAHTQHVNIYRGALGAEIVSAILSAPTDGKVTVVASAHIYSQDADDTVRCSITTGTTIDDDHTHYWVNPFTDPGPLTSVRVFDVDAGDIATYRLHCECSAGNAGAGHADLAAIFTPQA